LTNIHMNQSICLICASICLIRASICLIHASICLICASLCLICASLCLICSSNEAYSYASCVCTNSSKCLIYVWALIHVYVITRSFLRHDFLCTYVLHFSMHLCICTKEGDHSLFLMQLIEFTPSSGISMFYQKSYMLGSLKSQVFCAEYRLFYRALLQKRHIILRSLLAFLPEISYATSGIHIWGWLRLVGSIKL